MVLLSICVIVEWWSGHQLSNATYMFVSDIYDQGCQRFWFDTSVVKSYSKASFFSHIFRLKCLKEAFVQLQN